MTVYEFITKTFRIALLAFVLLSALGVGLAAVDRYQSVTSAHLNSAKVDTGAMVKDLSDRVEKLNKRLEANSRAVDSLNKQIEMLDQGMMKLKSIPDRGMLKYWVH